MWLGDDFFHNGAFRLSYGFEYAASMETTKQQFAFEFDRYDTFDWYLALGPAVERERQVPARAKFRPGTISSPIRIMTSSGSGRPSCRISPRVRVPDAQRRRLVGPGGLLRARARSTRPSKPHDTENLNFLVVGPWNHGGWNGDGEQARRHRFRDADGPPFPGEYPGALFSPITSRTRATPPTAEAVTFEAGANAWRTWDAWPPKARDQRQEPLFQRRRPALVRPAAETGDAAFDSYVSDPDHPVPYRHRPSKPPISPTGSGWSTWLVEDQRFVDDRPDVLSWESAPLEEDLSIAGRIEAHLFASTTGSDSRLGRQAHRCLTPKRRPRTGSWPATS